MIPNSRYRYYRGGPTAPSRRYANPHFRTRRADRFASTKTKHILARIPPRGWLFLVIFFAIAAGTVWLVAYAPVTQLSRIEVMGATYQDPLEIERRAWHQAEERRGLIFSQAQLILYDSDRLKQALLGAYPFTEVSVVKRLPATLRIAVTERTPVAVWFEADAYYEVDQEGWVVMPAFGPVEGLPTVYNNGEARLAEQRLNDAQEALGAALELTRELPVRLPSFKLKQLVVDNDRHTLKAIAQPNVLVYFATDTPLAPQLERLDILLRETLKDQLTRIDYIDLRYGDRVYYQ